jgi:hypothetical protein
MMQLRPSEQAAFGQKEVQMKEQKEKKKQEQVSVDQDEAYVQKNGKVSDCHR